MICYPRQDAKLHQKRGTIHTKLLHPLQVARESNLFALLEGNSKQAYHCPAMIEYGVLHYLTDSSSRLNPASPCPQHIRSYQLRSSTPVHHLTEITPLRGIATREQTTPTPRLHTHSLSLANPQDDKTRKAGSRFQRRIRVDFTFRATIRLPYLPHMPLQGIVHPTSYMARVTCTQPQPNIGLQPYCRDLFYPNPNAQCIPGSSPQITKTIKYRAEFQTPNHRSHLCMTKVPSYILGSLSSPQTYQVGKENPSRNLTPIAQVPGIGLVGSYALRQIINYL